MRILFVWPVCRFSVWDVARGYRGALSRCLGESNIKDYFLDKHIAYHSQALPPDVVKGDKGQALLSKFASESVLNEALYFGATCVIIVAGLNFHPAALWSLRRAGIGTVTILTESPYEDAHQADWASTYSEMGIVTTERTSAHDWGWVYLPHAYDPLIHFPVPRCEAQVCDVLMVGTGWPARQHLLEQIDWDGIDLRLYGLWPGITKSSPLAPFYAGFSIIDNEQLPVMYSSARVCLNIHRPSDSAESMGPRAYELAACGAYQISDDRQEVSEIFGNTVPVVEATDAKGLEREIRWALRHPVERLQRALRARECVLPHTFDARVGKLLALGEKVAHYASPHFGALPINLSGMTLVSSMAVVS